MALLLHEVWMEEDEDGQDLPSCLLAGPMGDGARRLQGAKARMVGTFFACSHAEAMNIYYAMFGWGKYQSDHDWDFQPYPDEWLETQNRLGPPS